MLPSLPLQGILSSFVVQVPQDRRSYLGIGDMRVLITDGNPDYLAWIARETAPN
jgi:hypothetical protein